MLGKISPVLAHANRHHSARFSVIDLGSAPPPSHTRDHGIELSRSRTPHGTMIGLATRTGEARRGPTAARDDASQPIRRARASVSPPYVTGRTSCQDSSAIGADPTVGPVDA